MQGYQRLAEIDLPTTRNRCDPAGSRPLAGGDILTGNFAASASIINHVVIPAMVSP
jgi:hypothetical protein